MILRTLLLAFALGATLCVAQDASPPKIRTGVLGAKGPPSPPSDRPYTYIHNEGELAALNLLPDAYRYAMRGYVSGRKFVVSKIELVSPDGARTLTLERFQQAANVQLDEARLFAGLDVTRSLVTNPNVKRKLHERLLKEVKKKGPGNYTLRGWALDIREGDSVRNVALLDGIYAKAILAGKSGWAYLVHQSHYWGRTTRWSRWLTNLEEKGGGYTRYRSRLVRLVRKKVTPAAEGLGISNALGQPQ